MNKFIDITKKLGGYVIIFIIGLVIGLFINLPICNKLTETVISIPVHDTITISAEQIKEKTIVKYVTLIDTFYIKSKSDTIYIKDLPIEYKNYKDTIKTDSTSTEININYHGFSSEIDSVYLKHDYFHKKEVIQLHVKKASPFIMIETGPQFNVDFLKISGAIVGIGAGCYIKESWGIGASYNFSTNLDHTIKLQLYKKF